MCGFKVSKQEAGSDYETALRSSNKELETLTNKKLVGINKLKRIHSAFWVEYGAEEAQFSKHMQNALASLGEVMVGDEKVFFISQVPQAL
ncbi:hypothetical protein D6817_03140 [Candidatus Pacearchaeota archaeon]|nr:MAG: hypothetical protein D6817_03140 [Candidatus Pacearchaeota archaeon]